MKESNKLAAEIVEAKNKTAQKLTPQVKKALEKWVTKLLTDPVIINFNGRRRVIR